MFKMSAEFDSLYRRLKMTRDRQAEALADSDGQIAALDRLMGKDKQSDAFPTGAPPSGGSTASASASGRK